MKKFYTEEMKNYVLEIYKGKSTREIQYEFNKKFKTNVTYKAMRSYLSANKIRIGRNIKRKYTDEHIKFVIDNVKGITLKELTNRFNKQFNMSASENAIACIKTKYKLSSGIVGGQFRKGQIPPNKGKKGYMSPEQYERCKPTMFKKGIIPANAREIGAERVDKSGYLLIKIQDGHRNQNWIRKHRYLYEQKYGRIPKGYKLIFADGNKRNFDLDNLILVSNSEELIMNSRGLLKDDKELTKTGAIIAKVIDKTSKIIKDTKNEK